MEIFCTQRLAGQLPVRMKEFGEREESTQRWSANLRTVGRRNVLILTQEQTGFAVVLYGVTRRELNRFGPVCTDCDGISLPEELNSMEKFLRCLGAYNFPSHPEHSAAARRLDRRKPSAENINRLL